MWVVMGLTCLHLEPGKNSFRLIVVLQICRTFFFFFLALERQKVLIRTMTVRLADMSYLGLFLL